MSEQSTVFGFVKGLYPGRICRIGPPVDWSAVKEASYEREKRDKRNSNTSVSIGGDNSSHTSLRSPSKRGSAPTTPQKKQNATTSSDKEKYEKRGSSGPIQAVSAPEKLKRLLSEPVIDMSALRKLAWAGLPCNMRAEVWKMLLGYVSTNRSRRIDTLERKRREYRDAVKQHYMSSYQSTSKSQKDLSPNTYSRAGSQEDLTMRQISVDLPRTCPGLALFHIPEVQQALERILYVWATRHPASGYVQGMNDLVTPFVYVFMAEHVKKREEKDVLNVSDLSEFNNPEEMLSNAEADAYWSLTTLLNDIQDYYTFSQPGIQRRVHSLRELVARVDSNLCSHLEEEGVDFLQFAFRWMNCLLMRELPFPLIVRVWDTYLAETDGFAIFHVYVCAALLVSFSDELLEMDFQDLVLFLQNLPTENWTWREIDVILSQAYMWRAIFEPSPSHLQ